MTHLITQAETYEQRITIKPIAALPHNYDVHIESRNLDSKEPEAWRTICRTTCQQWGLKNIGIEIWEAAQ
jgi:hypothetical protein